MKPRTEPVLCMTVDSSGLVGKLGKLKVNFLMLLTFKLGFEAQT